MAGGWLHSLAMALAPPPGPRMEPILRPAGLFITGSPILSTVSLILITVSLILGTVSLTLSTVSHILGSQPHSQSHSQYSWSHSQYSQSHSWHSRLCFPTQIHTRIPASHPQLAIYIHCTSHRCAYSWKAFQCLWLVEVGGGGMVDCMVVATSGRRVVRERGLSGASANGAVLLTFPPCLLAYLCLLLLLVWGGLINREGGI